MFWMVRETRRNRAACVRVRGMYWNGVRVRVRVRSVRVCPVKSCLRRVASQKPIIRTTFEFKLRVVVSFCRSIEAEMYVRESVGKWREAKTISK